MGCNLLPVLPLAARTDEDCHENRRVAPPSELARRWDLEDGNKDDIGCFIASDDVVDSSAATGGGVVESGW